MFVDTIPSGQFFRPVSYRTSTASELRCVLADDVEVMIPQAIVPGQSVWNPQSRLIVRAGSREARAYLACPSTTGKDVEGSTCLVEGRAVKQ